MTTTVEFPLPHPYDGNTLQDHIDALRDHADLRADGPLLDYLALAAAAQLEQQKAEIDRLRAVAWQLHSAMLGQHEETEHLLWDDCPACQKAAEECDPHYACTGYKRRQAVYRDALGLVIGPKPGEVTP